MANHWVLIRGIVSEEFHWWDFLPMMREKFHADTVHTADILGNGRHFLKRTPWGVHENVEALRAQIPQAAHEEPKILVGFSLGGMLALEWAHCFPDEVKAVVLINASLNNSPFHRRIQPGALARILRASTRRDLIAKEMEILDLTSRRVPEIRKREIAEHWGPRGAEYPASIPNFLRQLALAARIPQRKDPPPAPVLILSSGKDQVVHPECSLTIARNWDLPILSHEEAGHDLTLDDPHWVLEQLESWLARNEL